jgi:hypothetical protein
MNTYVDDGFCLSSLYSLQSYMHIIIILKFIQGQSCQLDSYRKICTVNGKKDVDHWVEYAAHPPESQGAYHPRHYGRGSDQSSNKVFGLKPWHQCDEDFLYLHMIKVAITRT